MRRVFLSSCQWIERYKSTTEESLKSASTATKQVTSRKTAKIQQKTGLTTFENSKKNTTFLMSCTETG